MKLEKKLYKKKKISKKDISFSKLEIVFTGHEQYIRFIVFLLFSVGTFSSPFRINNENGKIKIVLNFFFLFYVCNVIHEKIIFFFFSP